MQLSPIVAVAEVILTDAVAPDLTITARHHLQSMQDQSTKTRLKYRRRHQVHTDIITVQSTNTAAEASAVEEAGAAGVEGTVAQRPLAAQAVSQWVVSRI